MKQARIVVTKELLSAALNLPEGWEICGCEYSGKRHQMELRITGEGLPDIAVGDHVPEVYGAATRLHDHPTNPTFEWKVSKS